MKLLIIITSMVMLVSFCNREEDEPNSENNTFCNVENPLTDLEWLKQKVNESKEDTVKLRVYKVVFDGQEGFIVEECVYGDCSRPVGAYYDCSGNELCQYGGFVGNLCTEYEEKTTKKELIYSK